MTELADRIAALSDEERASLAARLASRKAVPTTSMITTFDRESGDFPLSYAQERLWFLDQLTPGNTAYNLSFAHALGFAVDHRALEVALTALVARHEGLRTTFPLVGDEPVQRVGPAEAVSCQVVDLRQLPPRRRRAETERLAARFATQPFDLATGPLFRSALIRLGESGDAFVFVIHHIVADGWSLEVLFRELSTMYAQAATHSPVSLPPAGPQYADYTLWQRRRLTGDALDQLVQHWKRKLSGAATLELPTDRPRPRVQSTRGAQLFFDIDASTVDAVRALSRAADATPFMVTLAAFVAMLHRYTHQDDIVVGSPVASRSRAEIEGTVGFFANSLVLRSDLGGDPTFYELVRRTRAMTMDAYEHQELPFSKLVNALRPGHDLSRNPLFQVSFQLLASHAAGTGRPNSDGGTEVLIDRGTAVFDLALNVADSGTSMRGQFEFNTDLFDRDTVAAMANHFVTLMKDATARPQTPVGQLAMLTPTELEQLDDWSQAPADKSELLPITEMIDAQMDRTPDLIAVDDGRSALSYAELRRRVARLADVIEARVGRRARVGIIMRPSVDLVTAVLAVIASGNAYVPIEGNTPEPRIAAMLADADVHLVLVDSGDSRTFTDATIQVLTADVREVGQQADAGAQDRFATVDMSAAAYVLFTSGSTGRPKGVVVSHRSLANYVRWCAATYPVADGAGAPLATSITSDMAVTSVFVPLVAGKTVFLLDDADIVEALDSALRGDVVFSFVKLTPSHLHALRNLSVGRSVPTSTRALVVGGEALRGETLEPWRSAAPDIVVWNEYGPTEATVACCAYASPVGMIKDGPVPIGRPISGVTLEVLDHHGLPVPVGVAGELHISGVGLAEGYIGDAELTSTRFGSGPNRQYRSGDLVRRSRDGTLLFLGRIDRQIKIRGHRVEPGDVESVLARHPAVDDCVVVARDLGLGDTRLVAYIAATRGGSESLISELAALARRDLPPAMTPSRFVVVSEIPSTLSGKTDTSALEALDRSRSRPDQVDGLGIVAPSTALQKVIAIVFADVLSVRELGDQEISMHDDFFAERGGDSLLATKAVARLREYLDIDLPLRELFEQPTVADLAEAILSMAEDKASIDQRAAVLLDVLALSDDEVDQHLEHGHLETRHPERS
jgi:amino acid adenylation domain-containing protein